jgi:signal transduction histidine kinase
VPVLTVVATAGGAAGVVLLTTSDVIGRPVLAALRVGALVAVHLVSGLYLWVRRPESRFPAILLLVAIFFALFGLAGIDAPWPHAIGRLCTFLTVPIGAYLFLAFPAGRVVDRMSRAVLWALLVAMGGGWLAVSMLTPTVSETAPLVACGDACPQSPLLVADRPDAAELATRVTLAAASALVLVVGAILLYRMRRASPPGRRVLAPVFVAAMSAVVATSGWTAARALDASDDVLAPFTAILAVVRLILPVCIAVGVMRDRARAGRALSDLMRRLGEDREAQALPESLARLVGDPGLVVARRVEDGWRTLDGRPVDPTSVGDGRSWTEVPAADGGPRIALLHDAALDETPELLKVAGSAAAVAVRQMELSRELQEAVDELRASRARIVVAAEAERRRLERDLHDGAQQALVALRVRVAVLRETLDGDMEAARGGLQEVEDELGAALEELRRLSRGLYPPLLADRGLAAALGSAAVRAAFPVSVEGDVPRLSRAAELAAYYCCTEALQNVAKHAGPGVRATVRLGADDGAVWFEVRDDGRGFDTGSTPAGTGTTGMRDRAAAAGGHLKVRSAPGEGTVVRGWLPLESRVRPAGPARA